MYKQILAISLIILISISSSYAQSVSVAGDKSNNSNFNPRVEKLKDAVAATAKKLNDTIDDLDKIKYCNTLNKIYDPDGFQPDAKGCTIPGLRISNSTYKKSCSTYSHCSCPGGYVTVGTGSWLYSASPHIVCRKVTFGGLY